MVTLNLSSELPAAPFFDRWVLEQPLPLAAAFLTASALVLFLQFRRGQAKAAAVPSGVLAALGVAVLLTGFLVTTSRELLTGRTTAWVQRVFAAQADEAQRDLSESLVIASGGVMFEGFGRDELTAIIAGFAGLEVTGWDQRPRGAVLDAPNLARVHLTIRARSTYFGDGQATLPSTWEFTWRRTGSQGVDQSGDQWQIVRLECLTMWGQPPRLSWREDATRLSRRLPGKRTGPSESTFKRDSY